MSINYIYKLHDKNKMTISLDIYNFPVYYISFESNLTLEADIKKRGWNNVNHFQAVKGKARSELEWFKEGVISLRTYTELIKKDFHTHDSIMTLGAIGCYMSHLGIWNIAVQKGYPYVIVMEDDINIKRKLSDSELSKISKALDSPKSLYVSAYDFHPILGHFYIARLDTCKIMIENALPAEMQVDVYMNSLSVAGLITKTVFLTYTQAMHVSSVQSLCLKCMLPSDNVKILLILTLLCVIVVFLTLKYKKCF